MRVNKTLPGRNVPDWVEGRYRLIGLPTDGLGRECLCIINGGSSEATRLKRRQIVVRGPSSQTLPHGRRRDEMMPALRTLRLTFRTAKRMSLRKPKNERSLPGRSVILPRPTGAYRPATHPLRPASGCSHDFDLEESLAAAASSLLSEVVSAEYAAPWAEPGGTRGIRSIRADVACARGLSPRATSHVP